ncbi:hypothetical protein [Actinomadura macra]|uniref:hypothetical protein n=1 Tax=Actinomadura macra TaxID=46164 RepID=UPI0012F820F3|nr:hypothetical protein [Actinomadura macra]
MAPLGVNTGRGAIIRAGARGLVAAMAMTGVRTVTAAVGPHERTPPEAIVEEHLPVVHRLPERYRDAIIELVHWAYGTTGGVVFGVLPSRVRAHPAAGPAYGLAIWLGFETGVAPALGVRSVRERGVVWRVVVALDHVLYGVVVAGRLAPVRPAARRPALRRIISGRRAGGPRPFARQASRRFSRTAATMRSRAVHRAKTP